MLAQKTFNTEIVTISKRGGLLSNVYTGTLKFVAITREVLTPNVYLSHFVWIHPYNKLGREKRSEAKKAELEKSF